MSGRVLSTDVNFKPKKKKKKIFFLEDNATKMKKSVKKNMPKRAKLYLILQFFLTSKIKLLYEQKRQTVIKEM